MESDLLDEQMRERLQQMQMEGTLDELIEQLIERMEQEDYISIDQPHDPSQQSSVGGQVGESQHRPSSKSRTRAWIFWDSRPCATCWDRWASRASGAMTRAIWPPASKPAALAGPTNSATR